MAIGDLVANLTADTSGFSRGLNRASADLSSFSGNLMSQLAGIGLAFNGLQSLRSMAGSATGLIKLAGEAEQAQVAFTTLLGSADKATKHLEELRDFAKSTPFEFTELTAQSRRLMALGFEADNVLPLLRTIGDAVGSLGLGSDGIGRITLALGQMNSKGVVSAQEMNQLAESGIGAWQMLADAIGTDIPTAMKMAENRAISSTTAISAILQGMQDRFAGGMEQQSRTILGKWSNLQDSLTAAGTKLGASMTEAFGVRRLLDATTAAVTIFDSALNTHGDTVQRVLVGLTAFAAAMVAVKVATLAWAASQRAATVASLILQGAINPALLAKAAIGLTAAAGAVYLMDQQLAAAGVHAESLNENLDDTAVASDNASRALQGVRAPQGTQRVVTVPTETASGVGAIGNSANTASAAVGQLNNTLGRIGPVAADSSAVAKTALDNLIAAAKGGGSLFPDADKPKKEIQQLYEALGQVRDRVGVIGKDIQAEWRVQDLTKQIEGEIGRVSGIAAQIEETRRKIEAYSPGGGGDRALELQKFDDAGATAAQIQQLEALQRKLDEVTESERQFKKAQELETDASNQAAKIKDEIDLLTGAASKADIAVRELMRQGHTEENAKKLSALMEERDSLKEGGQAQPSESQTLSAAAEFGSKEALSIIANASTRGKDPVEKNTATIAKEATKQTNLLTKLSTAMSGLETVGVVELPA